MSTRFAPGRPTEGRLALAQEALRLRDHGMTARQIAERLGCSRSYASSLCTDPDGEKDRARKKSYRGTCEECGVSTTGCYGPGKAPRLCASCITEKNRAPRAPHGTRTRYASGCSCDACRASNREYMRSLKGKEPPRHGTMSGYRNYACRCDACREAARAYQWLRPEYQLRWKAKRDAERGPRKDAA